MDNTLHSAQANDPLRKTAVVCPSCKQGYRLPARLLGRRLVCRHCRNEFRAKEVDSSSLNQLRPTQNEPPSDSGKNGFDGDNPPSAGAASVAIDTRWAGQTLGRYKILSVLGQGGMGVVWRGHDDKLRRDVALKILNRSKRKNGSIGGLSAELFMQEARAVAKLQHPAVVSIFEVAEDQGQVFLSLELMEGGTLKEYVDRKGPMAPRELFALMVGPAKALALAHDRGIIHRDIKPGNLMFDDHGHLKLMDFGLADVRDEEASEKIRGKAVGSLGWIAPETARGKGTTKQSDIYGMGLVMLYALTGKTLLHAGSRSKLIALHQNPPEPDYSSIRGLTPRAVAMLRKCLEVDQSKRFDSAKAMAAELQACADEDPAESSRRRRSHASIAAVAAVFGVIIGVGAVIYYFLDLLERENQIHYPFVTHGSVDLPTDDLETASDKLSPNPSGDAVQDAAAGVTARFASLEEAKVPWPQVPYLVDMSNVKYVGSVHGRVYHLPTTECGRLINASNLITFESREAADAAGRHLCNRCARSLETGKAHLATAPGEEQ